MDREDLIGFFARSPLFQDLEAEVLRGLADCVQMEAYPRSSVIHASGGPAIDRLRIIKEGAVKITVPFGRNDDALVDYRGTGEIIGFLSLLTGGRPRGEAVALEDTTCYVLDRTTVLNLLKSQPAFAREFFSDFYNRYVHKPHREIGKKRLLYGGGERLLFNTPVGELVKRDLMTASEDISIREAAQIMSTHRIGSLVLLNALGLPAGIVTNKDFRDRVVSRNRDVAQPVKRIQSVSLVKAEAAEHCIEALFKMLHYNIRHLLVVEGGRLKGIVTAQDLLRLQGASPIALVQELENQPSIDGLLDPAGRIQSMVSVFLREGVKTNHILRIMNELYDRLIRQAVHLAEQRLGRPPLPYCFLSLGCAGRKEQVFMLPQHNALIFADPPSADAAQSAARYFDMLSTSIVGTLERLGFPAAGEGDPAPEACRCLSSAAWKSTFSEWIKRADRRSIEASLPVFDFRARFGTEALAEDLRNAVFERIARSGTFLNIMALTIVKTSPPISAFKRFILEKEGGHKGCFDLKQRGLRPLVDIVRLYALKEGIRETSTCERLNVLRERSPHLREHCQELEYAFEIMSGLRLRIQREQLSTGGGTASFFLDPNHLNRLEKQALRAIFMFIAKLQFLVQEKHQPIKI